MSIEHDCKNLFEIIIFFFFLLFSIPFQTKKRMDGGLSNDQEKNEGWRNNNAIGSYKLKSTWKQKKGEK